MTKMKRWGVFALTLLLLAALPACGKKKPGKLPSEAVDDPNFPSTVNGVTLKEGAKKVLSLSPSLTELTVDLGYGEFLGGISDYCAGEDSALQALPACGTVNAPNLSEIRKLSPTVVLVSSPLSEADLTQLQQMNITKIILLPRAKTLEELSALYQNLGRVFEGEVDGVHAGATLFSEQSARLDEISAKVRAATAEKPLDVTYLRQMPLTVATGDTFEGALLEAAGFQNSASAYTGWQYPREHAIDLMPDVIFYDKTIGLAPLKATQIYNTTPAYAKSMCFEYDLEVFERQGVQMFDMLEDMARMVCPDAFAEDAAPKPEASSSLAEDSTSATSSAA